MNAFQKLRYKDNLSTEPELTQQDVADRTGLTKGAVSKIEKSGKANMDTLELYHKAFNASYEYLMGESSAKDIKYHALGELFPFDDSFYNNMKQLLALDGKNHFVEYMLSALLNDPGSLYHALIVLFDSLCQINSIQQDKELSSSAKTEQCKMHEYIFSQSMIEYLENHVMPLLNRGFEAKNEQLAYEAQKTEKTLLDLNKGTETATAENITVTPIENSGRE